jgi:hypothetical protein
VTLTHALARTDDEPLLDALAAALAGVSGALSCGRQVREWSHLSVAGGTPRVATPSQPLGAGAGRELCAPSAQSGVPLYRLVSSLRTQLSRHCSGVLNNVCAYVGGADARGAGERRVHRRPHGECGRVVPQRRSGRALVERVVHAVQACPHPRDRERERERERERTWLAEWEVERQTKARCDQAIPLQLNTIPC